MTSVHYLLVALSHWEDHPQLKQARSHLLNAQYALFLTLCDKEPL